MTRGWCARACAAGLAVLFGALVWGVGLAMLLAPEARGQETVTTSTSTTTLGMKTRIEAAEEAFRQHHGRQPKGQELREVVDHAREMPPGQAKKILERRALELRQREGGE